MAVIAAKAPGKFLMDCGEPNCYRHLTFDTQEAALDDQDKHPCPWSGPTKVSWSVTKTLVEQMWEKLDKEIDEIKSPDVMAGEQREYHKYRALAIAECIVLFMGVFFPDSKAVSKEALKRWESRQPGAEPHETAGLGQRRYEAAVRAAEPHASAAEGWYGTPDGAHTSDPAQAGARRTRATGRTRTATAAKVDISKFTEQELASIKSFNAQMPTVFTAKALSKTYGCTEAQIQAVLDS